MLKKLIISGALGEAAETMALYSVPTFRKYAKIHGYDFKMIGKYTDLPPAWNKVWAFQDYLKTYDIVLWLDCDAMIVKFDIDIADVFNFAIGFQAIPCEPDKPNSGVWLIRKRLSSEILLNKLITMSPRFTNPCWEQTALHHILGFGKGMIQPAAEIIELYKSGTILMPEKWNDQMRGRVSDEHRIVAHFAGRSNEEKIESLKALSEREKK